LLHVPASYDATRAVPLVLDFHGLFLSGAQQRALSGYAELSEREGFIVAFPNGIDNAWNVGPCCTFSRSVDDLGFARALVSQLEADACIDERRVYAAGYSMGGGMSHALACNAADVFAAVAPAAFDLLAEQPCAPSRGITNMLFRGTNDAIVPYAGGASRPPNGLDTIIHFLGAENTFARWASLNQCSGQPVETAPGCKTYSQCRDGAEVSLCTAAGGGHVVGDAEHGWQILKGHALP
jgi:poly(3-hydroxybutyrate) depolymerase